MDWLTERLRDVKQLRFAPALRIHAVETPAVEALAAQAAALESRLQTALSKEPAEPVSARPVADDSTLSDNKFIAGMLTRIWRIQGKVTADDDVSPVVGSEQLQRNVERIVSDFEERGLRIEDKQGLAYDAGMAVDVIASEPVSNITRPRINETIQPAVFRGDVLIQRAQVIVGVPDNTQ